MIYDDIPILKSIKEYADSEALPFHMPGHKRGKIFNKLGLEYLLENLIEMDTTEVPGVDNLHSPEGAVLEAQRRAAEAFGADYTFFLINGTTSGIYAMILAVTKPGDKILIPRNAHRSVVSGTILGKLVPEYLMPEIDPYMGIPMGIKVSTVAEALDHHPDAKAVFITSPTYYGACSDIEAIAKIVHDRGKLLLVDEAHGSHFPFHPELPISAIKAGADMAAQSTHKTLASMTGSSMLHVKDGRIDIDRLKFFLQLVQTTSPSHVMLASLDVARYIMEKHGHMILEECIKYSNMVRNEINAKSPFYCLGKDKINSYGIHDIDSTRITICLKGGGISGVKGEEILRNKYNIQVEMSDARNIVAISSIADDEESYMRLLRAVLDMGRWHNAEDELLHEIRLPYSTPVCSIPPYEALYRQVEYIDVEKSPGHISAEMAVPYPPGIPVLMPGEYIEKDIVDYLRKCIGEGIKISGVSDPKFNKIKVIK
ncbi:aminotransferase class I/II-fold pyridoxal phosphate-dependent enzyme [Lutispora thermophila]|uniref:Arginine decarboxylase n=1 Tax=Lutispora thermophila DSM 19022 TaxID=1122184 RepID=A0A1M6BMD0_9FIRM|nr:aminotransferase class V-fold PLP-dependent enzyme [Lutispora thermophila]SHI49960.1 arginine decarboxylase [Lutispora thermophila DSM 19022]